MRLEVGPTRATAVTQDQLMLRKELAERLIIEESGHEALEEMYFCSAVREYHPGGGHGYPVRQSSWRCRRRFRQCCPFCEKRAVSCCDSAISGNRGI
jgi:hypothetical protein